MIFFMPITLKLILFFIDSYGLRCSDLLDCGCYASKFTE